MINLTQVELYSVLDTIIKKEFIHIKPENDYYVAKVPTRNIPAGLDEDIIHDYKMGHLDAILDYIFDLWADQYITRFGAYSNYAELIRDFVIDKIQVEFNFK